MMRISDNYNERRGFTLLELLVVVAIIASLMSLSFVVMFGLADSAEEEATAVTVRKVQGILEQRIEAFDRAFKGTRKQQAINGTLALLRDPNSDGNFNDGIFGVRPEVLDILAKKALFRFEFPQRLEERVVSGDVATLIPDITPGDFSGMPDSIARRIALPAARTELIHEGNNTPTQAQILARATARWHGGTDTTNVPNLTFTGHDPVTESSELLYFAIIASGSYGASQVDSDRFTNQELQDTDGDGIPEFTDSWDQPLRFYRWPTLLMAPGGPEPVFQPILTDPNDPTDVITTVDTDGDGTPDTTVGQRQVTADERQVANILLLGLPPAPTLLPNGTLPRDLLLTDPDDPVGLLYSEMERLDGNDGRPLFRDEFNSAKYHTPDTYHTPLILSVGLDGELGLFEPNDTANRGNLAAYNLNLDGDATPREPEDFELMIDAISDNITSRNKRAGGRN
jgi:prepilin-type N-terminal cleavage/methylation domain-containing protein